MLKLPSVVVNLLNVDESWGLNDPFGHPSLSHVAAVAAGTQVSLLPVSTCRVNGCPGVPMVTLVLRWN
jgi:hypothetical protein